jgi:hypothetical protein
MIERVGRAKEVGWPRDRGEGPVRGCATTAAIKPADDGGRKPAEQPGMLSPRRPAGRHGVRASRLAGRCGRPGADPHVQRRCRGLLGPDFLGVDPPWPTDLDSHFRFLSGVFLAVGIGFYSTVVSIEKRTGRFRLLAGFVFAGGVARLLSVLSRLCPAGAPLRSGNGASGHSGARDLASSHRGCRE